MRTLANRGKAGLGNSLLNQGGHNCLCAFLGQRIIDFVGARCIAVALDLEGDAGIILHKLCDAAYFHH